MKLKLGFIHFIVFLAWGLLVARAFQLQVLPNKKLEDKIKAQFATEVTIYAKRGDIYDAKGELLATSVSSWSAYVDPSVVTQKDRMVDALSSVLKMKRSKVYKKLAKTNRFVWIKRKLSEEEYKKLTKLNLDGMGFIEEFKRVYFNRDSFSHIIGRVNIDEVGISGIELQYDSILRGKPIREKVLRDGKGRSLIFSNFEVLENLKGEDLHLSVDTETQVFLTKALAEQVKAMEAKRAWAVVVSAETGGIVSSAQIGEQKKNIAVVELHEPGSVLKTFSFLRAMQVRGYSPVDMFSCGQEGLRIGRATIRNAHKEECEELTLLEGFAKSLNTLSAELALEVGEKQLVNFYKKLGLDKKTGVDFPGEANSIFHDKLSGKHHLASISFGQGISLNTFQLLKAYTAISGEGSLITPHYIKGFIPQSSKKVIGKKDVFTIRGLLSAVVSKGGSAERAQVEGYLIGGKTGTSQKPDLIKGGYTRNVLSSFVGMFPLSNPKYLVYVGIDEPYKFRSGGATAAPVFSKIAEYLLRKDLIFPDKLDTSKLKSLAKLKYENQLAKPMDFMDEIEKGRVPNLKGLSLRESLQLAQKAGVKFKFTGHGTVHEMYPRPGKNLPENKEIVLLLN